MTTEELENIVEPPQSKDAFSSSKLSSSDSVAFAVDSEALGLSYPASTSSQPNNPDLLDQSSSRIEEYRYLFRLPSDEALIQDFNCALQENFLLQGHMYLFVHYICFYSNLFGFETKRIIPLHEITSIRRAKAVAVFPTAIEIAAGEKKYFFTSFLFRDEAFRLINECWQKNRNGTNRIRDEEDSTHSVSRQDGDVALAEELTKESVDDLDISQISKSGPLIEEYSQSGVGEFEIVPTSSPSELMEEVVEDAAQFPTCSSSSKYSTWRMEDADAPGVPEGYTKVVESKFRISVQEFFNLFFSDDGISFHESFHRKCGDKDFKCSPWRPYENSGHARDVSFQHPIKLYFGARFGSCQEIQKFQVYRNSHLVIDTSQDITDVPYGNYFKVEGRWDVQEVKDKSKSGCILKVYTNVAFSKKTMWKGKIVQSTIEECREAYEIWVELAHKLLKQKHLEQEEVGAQSTLVQLEKRESTLEYTELTSSGNAVSVIAPDTANPPNDSSEISTRSWSRSIFIKFSSSLKHQNNLPLLLVIAVAITFFLMQISIVMLLSRPQRILVIPQSDASNSFSGVYVNPSETVSSVTKQIKYLKEEMRFIETMLERMQQEHAQLKESLRKLELFRNN